jgi:hypothetical protein
VLRLEIYLIADMRLIRSPTMKFLLAATSLFVYQASALYAAGQPCRNNKDCEAGCAGARWTIGPKAGGGFELECDTPESDPLQFYDADCEITQTVLGVGIVVKDEADTAKACGALGGRNCAAGCVISGRRSADAATREKFKGACSAGMAQLARYDYEGEAQRGARCS